MWSNIINKIQNQDYISARILLEKAKKEESQLDDTFWILEATVCQAEENGQGMYNAMKQGFAYNPENYELYYMLACYYKNKNIDQAYLCLENAMYFCGDEDDFVVLETEMQKLKNEYILHVKPTIIIIVTYNLKQMQIRNIESIRNTLSSGSYQIIAVDNGSTDGVAEWLREQKDIMLIRNKENKGFSCACNQGALLAKEMGFSDYNILLLNNDTQLCLNSLFWLRMALYENRLVGAAGSVSNYAGNEQQIEQQFDSLQAYLDYGRRTNILMDQYYEERVRLSGFAVLIRGDVWNAVGGLDEAFSPGYFEDDALCMQILKRGYRNIVCKNSFIYHAGSQSFSKKENVNDLLLAHHQLFIQKYGFDILRYAKPDRDIVQDVMEQLHPGDLVLQLNAGLGADLRLLSGLTKEENIYGLERNAALGEVIQTDDRLFTDMTGLREQMKNRKIDILIATPAAIAELTLEERKQLALICHQDCKIIPAVNPYGNISFDKIKLVIWDMDDTFWRGTLSEEPVSIPDEHIQLIKMLTQKGIINSISSKNDEESVLGILRQYGIEELFVFNQINWDNKGSQIEKKLEAMGLRDENVLFIDDSSRNLQEAKHFCPNLMVAAPDIIPHLIRYANRKTATDAAGERITRYKLLEKKNIEKQKYNDNKLFLLDSRITISIGHDCLPEIDRIAELVARTNQLNYTKNRCDKKTLIRQISDDWMDAAYIKLSDKYGEYGIVGFYCYNIRESRMEHFLFSCRVLGMRLEQYIYQKTGSPVFEINGSVASPLSTYEEINWIKEEKESIGEKTEKTDSRIKILLKGPCDLSTVEPYLIGGKVTTEFNYVSENGIIVAGQNHSMHIWESAHLSKNEIDRIIESVPFLDKGDFETMLFSKKYHVICYSLLPDCHAGLYRNKNTGNYISFGSANFDLTDDRLWDSYCNGRLPDHGFSFTKEVLEEFAEQWEFVGTTKTEDIIRNIKDMYDNALGDPVFILLLGSEKECEVYNAEFENHAQKHQQVNKAVSAFAEGKERIKLIRITDLIHDQDDYDGCINHFSRRVYYDLATEIVKCINNSF